MNDTLIEHVLDIIQDKDLDSLRDFLREKDSQKSSFLNQPDETGTTPLMGAIDAGSVPAVRLLIEHGADVNHLSDNVNYPPLLRAVLDNNLEIAAVLLESGADPDACWMDYSSARSFADFRRKTKFLDLFAAHTGLSLDAIDPDRRAKFRPRWNMDNI